MSATDKLFIQGMGLLPKKPLSRNMRRLAGIRSRMAVRRFAALYDLDMDEAEHPLEAYESVLDLFTRRLKPGAREIDPAAEALVSPVDGAFLVGGPIPVEGTLVQAKGREYTLDALLAEPGATARYAGGCCLTVYLAPHDYHRIHCPVDGEILGWTHVPGELWPVNGAAVAHVDALFARNERLITHVASETFGRVEVIKVGATNVGHISLVYDESVRTNDGTRDVRQVRYDTPKPVARADELGVFELGSTVILVIEKPVALEAFAQGDKVRLGQRLGVLG